MNGAYWGLTTLHLLGKLDTVDVHEVVSWIISCQHDEGGFGGNVGHDPHILYTLSAVQVLALFNKLDVIDVDKVTNCILSRFCETCCRVFLSINKYTILDLVLLNIYVRYCRPAKRRWVFFRGYMG